MLNKGLSPTDRHSHSASAVLGMVLPVDTLLYLLLPLYAAQFGVTIAEAGVLLAANRLVRIAGYGWVARFYARQGDRLTCTLAVAVAAICAIGHATLSNFWMLLPLRLLWGLSYAALNLSTQVLATAELDGAARRTGRSRAIIAMGPALALPIGAVLAEAFGPRSIFVLLAGISLIALVVTRELPSAPHPVPQQARGFRIPNSLDTWSFLEGLTLDGLFIIGLSYLGRDSLPGGAVVAVGLLLAMRYLGEMLLSPAGGRLAELFGPEKVLVTLSLLTSIALIGFGAGWLWGCAASIVILRSLQLPLMAPIVARRTSGPGRVQALASRATWRDIGAGAGPILAGALLPVVSPVLIYSVSALLLACAALACVSPFVNPDRNSISP